MRILASLAAVLGLCSGSVIPLVPGDNSHYVEGESRFIWMPDSEGVPHLVDLERKPDLDILRNNNGANNQYWLYTRLNPKKAQIINHGDEDTIKNSNYNGSRPLKVIVHGWNNNGNSDLNPLITSAFLDVMDTNVIIVDWSGLANSNYISAAHGVPSVGEYLGNFLVWLVNTTGGDWNKVHLVGFSLGAHVVGTAGRTAGGLPARVSGLDPAGPLWRGNENALNTSSGQHVESIHTDAGIFGLSDAISHADFFPNGGRNPQPKCWTSICSHNRSTKLFASSVRTDHFVGYQCSDKDEARKAECRGNKLNMGNGVMSKQGSGIYGLTTKSEWPF